MKSDIEIEDYIRNAIIGSPLEKEVSGVLSVDGRRPNNSTAEDIVVRCLANESAGQIQRAYVNVNVYVSDKYDEGEFEWKRDSERIGLLCDLCKPLFTIHGNGVRVSDADSSQKVNPTGVVFQDGHTEHFINNRLQVEICNY